jgi:hypothetical protein
MKKYINSLSIIFLYCRQTTGGQVSSDLIFDQTEDPCLWQAGRTAGLRTVNSHNVLNETSSSILFFILHERMRAMNFVVSLPAIFLAGSAWLGCAMEESFS